VNQFRHRTLEEFILLSERPDRFTWSTIIDAMRALISPGFRKQRRELAMRRSVALQENRRIFIAMSVEERANTKLVDHARRQQIADAAGVEPMAVSNLLRAFRSLNKTMDQLAGAEPRDASC
jgi:signal recognition particle GTPase